jgi:transposase InsO family protein
MRQARALQGSRSPATGRAYPLSLILTVFGLARSTFYEREARRHQPPSPPRARLKTGPKTELSDSALVEAIREVLNASPFSGEGHRKVRVRLIKRGIHAGKNRILRLMGLHGLLAPRRGRRAPSRTHDGTIITERPNEMWGGDATEVMTTRDGKVTIFDLIDHCTDQILGITVTTDATRFSAIDCLHQGVLAEFGALTGDVARGVTLRVDHGSQFTSKRYVNEAHHLGFELSFAFVGQPECNGVIERWHRTLKEQLVWTRTWSTAEEVREAVTAFVRTYNEHWLIERNGHRTPNEHRESFNYAATAA